MKISRHNCSNGALAFTLVEMLISVTLSAMVITIVIQMTNSSIKAVGDATGAMSVNEKFELLRSRLSVDLSRAPWPTSAGSTLVAAEQQGRWSLKLLLPITSPAGSAAWSKVEYAWDKQSQTLTRSEKSLGSSVEAEPHDMARGVLQFSAKWLSTAQSAQTSDNWNDSRSLPAAVQLELKLVGEEQISSVAAAQEQKARSFHCSMNVGG